MTHWKQQLHQMHQACNIKIKRCFLLLVSICLFLCVACTRKQIESITLSEWIHILNEESGIQYYENTTPYFLNITQADDCFQDVQAAVEWKVLDPQFGFEPDDLLNRELVAYTLMNLAGKEQSESLNIADISNSIYKKQIQAAVSSGLMKMDMRHMFHPEELVDKNEAEQLLKKVVQYLNDREIEKTETNIDWNENSHVDEISVDAFDEESKCIMVQEDQQFEQGQIIHFQYENEEYYYEVVSQNGMAVYLKDIDLLEKTNEIQMSGTAELDFSNATIIGGENQVVQETSAANHLSVLSTKGLQKTLHIKDFDVVITTNGTRIRAEVTKTLEHGSVLYAAMKLNGVTVDYQWKSQKKEIQDAYFKVNLKAEESLGLKNGSYKNLYGDFSKIDRSDFVSTLKNLFQEKKDVVESTLELCKIRLPIPNAPLLNVTIAMNLRMYVSGRAEIYFTQSSMIGCEIREGNMRMIHDLNTSKNNRIKASTGIGAGLTVAINMTSLRLMDAMLHVGGEAALTTSFHVYHENEHEVVQSDVSYDVAQEIAEDNPDILVCSDISANLIVYLKLNSAKSQLGKLGFTHRIDLVKESLIPKGYKHLENFHFVDKCTRKDREKKVNLEPLKVSKKILLQDYSMIVHSGEKKKIEIKGLPENYKLEDMVYVTSDSSIVEVSSDGIVEGKKGGSAVITIQTSDEKHYVKCNILVPEVSK